MQRLQFFLPESRLDAERVSSRQLELLRAVWGSVVSDVLVQDDAVGIRRYPVASRRVELPFHEKRGTRLHTSKAQSAVRAHGSAQDRP